MHPIGRVYATTAKGVAEHPTMECRPIHLMGRVNFYTLGCAIWTTLKGVNMHLLGLVCSCCGFQVFQRHRHRRRLQSEL